MGWKHRLPSFLLAPSRRRLQPSWFYQHLLDGSTNSLVYRHWPKGSYDSLLFRHRPGGNSYFLPCTTLPPCSINQFTSLLLCYASTSMSLDIVTPLHLILDSVFPLSPCIYTSNLSSHLQFIADHLNFAPSAWWDLDTDKTSTSKAEIRRPTSEGITSPRDEPL